jgi:hypothetical protein
MGINRFIAFRSALTHPPSPSTIRNLRMASKDGSAILADTILRESISLARVELGDKAENVG